MSSNQPTPISAFVVTLNEQANIARCLNSLREVAAEIVVVDSGSSDATRDIAAGFGARVIEHPWEGFVGQKNFAAAQCSNDWVLSVDADEELSVELREQLQSLRGTLAAPLPDGINAYAMPRRVWYLDRWIRHGDWYPDYVTRLYYRPAARFAGGAVHESLVHPGKAERLRGDLLHYTYTDRADHLARVRNYSGLWAASQRQNGRRVGPLAPYLRAVFRFWRAYFLRAGALDGRRGLEIAAICSYEVFLKYQRLRAMGLAGGEMGTAPKS